MRTQAPLLVLAVLAIVTLIGLTPSDSYAAAPEAVAGSAECSLSADATLADIVAVRHLDGPLDGVVLVVEDTNPFGAMPTLVLHILFRAQPDTDPVCFGLRDGELALKFHRIDIANARLSSFDMDGGVLRIEVVEDFNLSCEPSQLELEIDLLERTVSL